MTSGKISNPDDIKLTVVCPAYNHARHIRRALDGFVSQKTDFKFEVLVGDDASTDETPDIIRQYADKHPDLIKPVLREKNLGAAHNFQDLIKNIDTEYVALCEGDDYWTDPAKLQKQFDFLESHKNFAVCYHPVLVRYAGAKEPDDVNPSKKQDSIFYPHPLSSPYERPVQTLKDVAVRSVIPTCSVMYRWRFRRGRDLNLFRTDVNPRDVLNNMLHAETGDVYFINEIMGCYFRPHNSMWKQKDLFAVHALPMVKFYEFTAEHFGPDIAAIMSEEKKVVLPLIIEALLKNGRLEALEEIFREHRESYDLAMTCLGLSTEAEKTNNEILNTIRKKRRDLRYVGAALILSLICNIILALAK